jgi:hypothetical protein
MRVDAVLRCGEEDGQIEKVRREWQIERCVCFSVPLRVLMLYLYVDLNACMFQD